MAKKVVNLISSRSHFPALTGIRAIAVTMVFFFHNFEMFRPFGNWAVAIAKEFHTGVPLFFVLSGFLITFRYSKNYQPSSSWWKGYLQNRFARIYPVYLLITIATLWAFHVVDPFEWVISLSLTKGYFFGYRFNGIRQIWSLTVEETFYLFAPLMFVLMKRFHPLAILGAVYLLGTAVAVMAAKLPLGVFASDPVYIADHTFFGQAFTFIIGAWLAVSLLKGKQKIPVFELLGPIKATYAGAAGIGGMILALTLFQGSEYWSVSIFNWKGILFHHLLLPVFIATLFYGLIMERTWIQKVLSSRFFDVLGRSSYLFYLIHYGIVASWLSQYTSLGAPLGSALERAALFILLWGVSIAIYLLVEEPLHWILRSKPSSVSQTKKDEPINARLARIPRRLGSAKKV